MYGCRHNFIHTMYIQCVAFYLIFLFSFPLRSLWTRSSFPFHSIGGQINSQTTAMLHCRLLLWHTLGEINSFNAISSILRFFRDLLIGQLPLRVLLSNHRNVSTCMGNISRGTDWSTTLTMQQHLAF